MKNLNIVAIAILATAACASEPSVDEATSSITRQQHNDSYAWCSASVSSDCTNPAPPGINQCFGPCGVTYDPVTRKTTPPNVRAGCGNYLIGNLGGQYVANDGVWKCYLLPF